MLLPRQEPRVLGPTLATLGSCLRRSTVPLYSIIPMTSLESLAPAIAMLAAFACLLGGGTLIAKRQNTQKGVLMLVMAAVLVGNVLIWTM